ncbi:putative dextransucrase [Helianthus annuus]|uniref:Dextransucrase n=1 Tax=Helianthus annuus TaxID=4232 RepID=A0A251RTB6_HELAN|nr:pollen-specific leucine-rich repeat extensin-like protein 1 [Helianthus annuus]KAF5756323.1 putative dextransucrase [Helianthus annuus]KAJ0429848.1 putative dextransucrase [Helianthus annuus]
MAPEKVTEMILYVDLKCSGCYKKVKKVTGKMPQIRDQVFDVDKNEVRIKVVCCSPENIRDKLCYKGGGAIQSIEIVEKPKAPPGDKPKEPAKPAADKPKEPEKPKPAADKPKETTKPPVDKPKEPEKPKPAADKPKEPEKAKPAADKPKDPEKAKPAADKPKEPEKPKPAADKPKEPEKAKPAADKPKEPEKPKPAADKPKEAQPADKPKEAEKPKPADKPKDSGKPPEPEKAKPKEADKPNPPKEGPITVGAGPNPEVAKMVYEPVHGYPQMYPLSGYPMVGYGQHYDHYYGDAPFQNGYGTLVAPQPPPSYGGFGYGYENGYNGYNDNRSHYASNDYGGEGEDGEGCSIM